MEGYPKLALLQGNHPELGIYRRFSTLNARNLLYLQAEIVDLEVQLNSYTAEDFESEDVTRKRRSRNWHYLSRLDDDELHNSQWHTFLEIREKLKEYNECLLQQRQLATFDAPETGNLAFLRSWISDPAQGNLALQGRDQFVWNSSDDLLVVTPDHLSDGFTRNIIVQLVNLYHRIIGSRRKASDRESGVYEYKERAVVRAADIIGTLISGVLPVLAVVVLYFANSMGMRLGFIALFTVLFSLSLVIVTKAKRIEVFAATAAFASVQVVFVGSTST